MVMERLLTSLHDLLDPETETQLPPDAHKASLPLSLKCSILHNVASGLAIAAHHPPRLVCAKHSPYLGDGGHDCRLGRSSYRASYEDCSDNDKRAWGLGLHASRVSIYLDPTEMSIENRSKYDASIGNSLLELSPFSQFPLKCVCVCVCWIRGIEQKEREDNKKKW